MKKLVRPIIMVVAAALTALATIYNVFYGLDALITDRLYTKLSGTYNDIVIIGIDEETEAEFGKFETWSREKTAELLEFLYSDPENEPAVVTLDIMFVGDGADPETDARLAAAAAKGKVVTASHIVYRGKVEESSSGEKYYNSRNIDSIEEPYPALAAVTTQGFANAYSAEDGYVRYALNKTQGGNLLGIGYATY